MTRYYVFILHTEAFETYANHVDVPAWVPESVASSYALHACSRRMRRGNGKEATVIMAEVVKESSPEDSLTGWSAVKRAAPQWFREAEADRKRRVESGSRRG